MAHAAAPALDTNHGVAFGEHAQLDGLTDAPLETLIDVFLPVDAAEVRLGFWEMEGVDAAIEVSVARSGGIPSDHDDRADWAILGHHAGRGATFKC
jgi:hypothetical protein